MFEAETPRDDRRDVCPLPAPLFGRERLALQRAQVLLLAQKFI
ncbi:MAG: hypothetical protein QOJ40_1183 [Verrucomicrobiota bacterium]